MKVAMIGHKVVPSRRGGIENVLTTLCPLMVEKGVEITCYNRSADKVENEYDGTVKNGIYRGVRLKKAWTLDIRGIAAMIASFTAAICDTLSRRRPVCGYVDTEALWQKVCCNSSRARLAKRKMGKWICFKIHKIR